jgi:hypothetical protein
MSWEPLEEWVSTVCAHAAAAAGVYVEPATTSEVTQASYFEL